MSTTFQEFDEIYRQAIELGIIAEERLVNMKPVIATAIGATVLMSGMNPAEAKGEKIVSRDPAGHTVTVEVPKRGTLWEANNLVPAEQRLPITEASKNIPNPNKIQPGTYELKVKPAPEQPKAPVAEPKQESQPARKPHTIKSGELVWSLAATDGGAKTDLERAAYVKTVQGLNPGVNLDKLKIGQTIVLPETPPQPKAPEGPKTVPYTVQESDNAWTISQKVGGADTPQEQGASVKQMEQIAGRLLATIKPGDIIQVPVDDTPPEVDAKTRAKEIVADVFKGVLQETDSGLKSKITPEAIHQTDQLAQLREFSVEQFMAAIASQESSGDPNAVAKSTKAHGYYQIMPSNWPVWSKEVFGEVREKSPENQTLVARHKMLEYYENLNRDWRAVAIAWFAGPRRAQAYLDGDMSVLKLTDGGMTVEGYVNKMVRNIGKIDPDSIIPEFDELRKLGLIPQNDAAKSGDAPRQSTSGQSAEKDNPQTQKDSSTKPDTAQGSKQPEPAKPAEIKPETPAPPSVEPSVQIGEPAVEVRPEVLGKTELKPQSLESEALQPELSPEIMAKTLAKRIFELEAAGKITFDPAPNDRIRQSIVDVLDDGRTFKYDVDHDANSVLMSPDLLAIVVRLAEEGAPVAVGSVTTSYDHAEKSHHYDGRAIDINPDPENFRKLYDNREEWGIDELILNPIPQGTHTLSRGKHVTYGKKTMDAHINHIHFSVKAK